MQRIWLLSIITTAVYATLIVSPTFDLDVVRVEDGEYHIESVEPGVQQYLSMTGIVDRLCKLVGFQIACCMAANVALAYGYDRVLIYELFKLFMTTSTLSAMQRPVFAILSSYKMTWRIQTSDAADGSFRLENEWVGLVAMRSRDCLESFTVPVSTYPSTSFDIICRCESW